jgi:DNA-directed RNA polymerase subunit RPC12/RpoP
MALGTDADAEGEGSETERARCTDCGEHSPPAHTAYTLISSQFGWRLMREELPDGTKMPVWRCPSCWRKVKAATGHKSGPP